MNEIKYGVLHCHTENSLRDSVMSVQALVETAKSLGAPAIALTDHGTMTGYIDFLKECQKADVKAIVGVEAYVEEESEGRKHLILMAKDYTGFKALIKAVTESNTRLVNIGKLAMPRMNKAILAKWFGPGTMGHGHVIATSACAGGPLGVIISANASIDDEVEKIAAERDKYESPESKGYKKNKETLEALRTRLKELSVEIAEVKKSATRSLLAMERKALTAPEGSEKKAAAQAAFDAAFSAKKAAAEELEKKMEEKKGIEAKIKTLKPIIEQLEKSIGKWRRQQGKIDAIKEKYISDAELDRILETEAAWYRDNFGSGDFYIELQYHGMKEEKRVMTKLATLSDIMGIPVCIANDAHIPRKTGDDILARAIIRTTMFDKWTDPTASDKELYIKTDEELIEKISEIIPREKVLEGYENVGKIVSQCDLEIPSGNHYPKFAAPDGSTPEEYLRGMVYDRLPKRYPVVTDEIRERVEHELNVICSMGYADYHCIVEDLLRYARAAGKLDLKDPKEIQIARTFDTELIEEYTKDRVGECVGPGRGSAGGSIVCYIIGITNIDPLKYGLLFERFLNPDRISMPDIDCGATCSVTSLKR